MEARIGRLLLVFAALAQVAATHRTPNFVVTAPTPEIARQVGLAAEHYRKELAEEWLGYELPRWYAPCPVKVKVGSLGAGGQTTFSFHSNPAGPDDVNGWDMQIQGSLERILDSVLPHEVSHTIFACHFRRPLPRWADEGAATLAEHESERRRQVLTVQQVMGTKRRIPMRNLLNIKEYPRDMQDVLTLYAQGYSLAELLVQQGGRAKYLQFLADAHKHGWDKSIEAHYGYHGVDALEKRWQDWVIAGSPELNQPEGTLLADAGRAKKTAPADKSDGAIVRGQKPDDPFVEKAVAMVDLPRSDRATKVAAPEPKARPRSKGAAAARPQTGSADSEESDHADGPLDTPERHNEAWISLGELRSARDDDADREAAPEHEPATPKSRRPARTGQTGEETERPAFDDDADAPRRQARPLPEKTKPAKRSTREMQLAGVRAPAKRREVTPWSEFPADPRPSPLDLSRSGSPSRP